MHPATRYALWAVLLWSTVATAFKLTLRLMDPMTLVAWASLVSWAALGVMVWRGGHGKSLRDYSRRAWPRILVLGSLVPPLYYGVLFTAYERLPAQEAQAINYSWALMLAILSVPMLGHRFGFRDLLAGVLGYIGVLIIATRGELASLHFTDPIGVGLALASTILWAVYWLLSTRESARTEVALFANFTVGVVWVFAWILWRNGSVALPSIPAALGVVYIGLFEMSLTFVLWGRALKSSPKAARVANLIYLSPPISLLLIHWLVGEPIYPSTIVALILILSGVFLSQTSAKGGR